MSEKHKPQEMTPEGFCRLVMEKSGERKETWAEIFRISKMSSLTWWKIRKGEIPSFTTASSIKLTTWGKIVTKLAIFLDLDVVSCFEAVGLPWNERVYQMAKAQMTETKISNLELKEGDLKRLLRMARERGKPIPLSFVIEYLSLVS